MKELSIEEKAKAYDNAVINGSRLWECGGISRENYEYIFPELKESEDERIRKEIIRFIRMEVEDEIVGNKWLAWLEKQKEPELSEDLGEYVAELSKQFPEVSFAKLSRIAVRVKNWLEKQGESDETKAKMFLINKGYPIDTNGTFPTYEEMYNIIREGLENQGELKPTDKAKPKFKVGDWITDGEAVFHITSYSIDYGYQLETPKGTSFHFSDETVEKKYHLWTIQDAKEGDVLYHKAENGIEYIVMSKGLNEHNNIDSYFRYNSIDGFGIDIPSVLSAKYDSITPATKEQRDQLEKAMADAGYEWNAEKKELKEIEDEEYNGEDYGIDSLYHAQRILEKTLGEVDGYQTDDGILSHKCAISAVKKLYEQKSALSEEDELNLKQAIYVCHQNEYTAVENWLKSLKDRVQPIHEFSDTEKQEIFLRSQRPHFWRPSEEQMEALKGVQEGVFRLGILESLYNDLKKLKP